MSQTPVSIVVIIASTRPGRLGSAIAAWVVEQARRRDDLEVEVIDLASPPFPPVLSTVHPGNTRPAAVDRASLALGAADGFVVVTPEHNHSYPAALKNAIDWFTNEWHAKPVGFVSYGGISGGLRAVEHLRNVFSEVQATTIRHTVSFANVWDQFSPEGPTAVTSGALQAVDRMLEQLVWWARVLRSGRHQQRYPA